MRKYKQRIDTALERLGLFSESGKEIVRHQGLRKMTIAGLRNYVVIYNVRDSILYILRVVHTSRKNNY